MIMKSKRPLKNSNTIFRICMFVKVWLENFVTVDDIILLFQKLQIMVSNMCNTCTRQLIGFFMSLILTNYTKHWALKKWRIIFYEAIKVCKFSELNIVTEYVNKDQLGFIEHQFRYRRKTALYRYLYLILSWDMDFFPENIFFCFLYK